MRSRPIPPSRAFALGAALVCLALGTRPRIAGGAIFRIKARQTAVVVKESPFGIGRVKRSGPLKSLTDARQKVAEQAHRLALAARGVPAMVFHKAAELHGPTAPGTKKSVSTALPSQLTQAPWTDIKVNDHNEVTAASDGRGHRFVHALKKGVHFFKLPSGAKLQGNEREMTVQEPGHPDQTYRGPEARALFAKMKDIGAALLLRAGVFHIVAQQATP